MVFNLYDLEQLKLKLFLIEKELNDNKSNNYILNKDWIHGYLSADDLIPRYQHKDLYIDLCEVRLISADKSNYEVQFCFLMDYDNDHGKDIKNKLIKSLQEYNIKYYIDEQYVNIALYITDKQYESSSN